MIFFTLLLLLLLREGCWGSKCGQPPLCHCNPDIGLLACLDRTLKTWPNFTRFEKISTVHLDISNTQLITLPPFNIRDWPRLKIVDIRSNPQLDICHKLKSVFTLFDLTLHTDCTSKNVSDKQPEQKTLPAQWIISWISVITFTLEMIAAMGIVIARQLRKTRKHAESVLNSFTFIDKSVDSQV